MNGKTTFVIDLKNSPPTCPLCEEKFKYRYKLEWHFQWKHRDEVSLFMCTCCNDAFTSAADYKRHVLFYHRGLVFHACEECSSCFRTDLELKKHQLQHKKLPQLQCGRCESTFQTESSMSEHMAVHKLGSGSKAESCRGCFSRRSFSLKHPKSRRSQCSFLACVGKKVCDHGKCWATSL